MKIAILRETKTPPDRRVPLNPMQCRQLQEKYPNLELVIQSSEMRCYADSEYLDQGIKLQENLDDCDILMGVKEVEIESLLAHKTYLFFSHTAKKQSYNQPLLQALSKGGNTLLDYEYLTRKDGTRVVAFGRWAGIVGAYNGLKAYGQRTAAFELPPAWKLSGLEEMKAKLKDLVFHDERIVLTGGGRVAGGAEEIMEAAGIKELTPLQFLSEQQSGASYTRLDPWHYTRHIHGKEFDFPHFVTHPEEYINNFLPYARLADIYIACHFWDPKAPLLLSKDDLREVLPIKVIADISCDIDGPIASTLRASTIANPTYLYDPQKEMEVERQEHEQVITVMAVDNLPGELPRDASTDFGTALSEYVIPSIVNSDDEGILERSMILQKGKLTESYAYLKNFLEGKE